MSRNNILLLSAGRRVELYQSIAEAASRLLPTATVYCADSNPELSSACAFAQHSVALPFVNQDDYCETLLDICDKLQIGLVIPTIDTELQKLASISEIAAQSGTTLVISEASLIARCRDKRLTAILFRSLAIDTPEIYSVDAIQFPCFSKPVDGSSGIGAFRIDGVEFLTPELLQEPNRMFMELIPSHYREITIDLYFDTASNLKAAIPRERIEIRAGEVSKGVTRRDWVYDYVLAKMNHVEGARGCLTLQLFADDQTKTIKAIEINPRFGGGYPLAHSAGADFPDFLIREYLIRENIAFFDDWQANLLMLRYDAKVVVNGYC